MEAGDNYNSLVLNLEEDSIGKTPDTRTSPPSMNNRKLQWVLGDCLNRSLYSPRKALPKLRAHLVVPGACLLQLRIGLR